MANEKLNAEMILEKFNMAADGAARNMQFLPRRNEPLVTGGGFKGA